MKITQKPSPNFTNGRAAKIDRILMHWIVGNLDSANATFANPKSGVSAHYGIEGLRVHQYVAESDTAWHAGNGAMNSRSIGIEHSAAPGRDAAPSTIESSAQLLAEISKRHAIPLNRTTVLKHSEVVATQCPGTIPIDDIIRRANELLNGESMIQDTDQEFSRWQKIGYQIRGRNLTRDEFKQAAVGGTWLNAIEVLSDNAEADTATKWQDVGQYAVADEWETQIKTLKKENADFKAELATQSDDTKQLNAFGEALKWFITRLGLK